MIYTTGIFVEMWILNFNDQRTENCRPWRGKKKAWYNPSMFCVVRSWAYREVWSDGPARRGYAEQTQVGLINSHLCSLITSRSFNRVAGGIQPGVRARSLIRKIVDFNFSHFYIWGIKFANRKFNRRRKSAKLHKHKIWFLIFTLSTFPPSFRTGSLLP